MSRDIRRKSIDPGDNDKRSELDKQLEAAFSVFWSDYDAKYAIFSDPDLPTELKYALIRSIKSVFSAGFSSAYASYIVGQLAAGKQAK
jgi:cation transport regulator ChaB